MESNKICRQVMKRIEKLLVNIKVFIKYFSLCDKIFNELKYFLNS